MVASISKWLQASCQVWKRCFYFFWSQICLPLVVMDCSRLSDKGLLNAFSLDEEGSVDPKVSWLKTSLATLLSSILVRISAFFSDAKRISGEKIEAQFYASVQLARFTSHISEPCSRAFAKLRPFSPCFAFQLTKPTLALVCVAGS